MSRLPRHLEHLKTGFTAEAVSAAMFRAFAEQAEGDGKANLARRWRRLAEEKDGLAILQLRAAGKVQTDDRNLREAIAEEQYENDVLYPRLVAEMEYLGQAEERTLLERILDEQRGHLAGLDELRRELTGARGDVAEGRAAGVGAGVGAK